MPTEEELAAQAAAEKEAQDAAAARVAAEAKGLSKEKADELLAQKRKANKEAQDAKKEADTLRAELQAIKDKDLSDKDLAEKKAADLELELAKERKTNAHLGRVTLAQGKGIDPEYTDYVASELKKATEAEGDDFKADEWFEKLEKNKPAFFGGNGEGAGGSAEGGASRNSGNQSKATRLAEIKKEMARLSDHNVRSREPDAESKLWNLRAEMESIEKDLRT